MELDTESVSRLIQDLFRITDKLTDMTGRKFTPDGHLVGSIGEVLASAAFGLELVPHSTKGHDAKKDGIQIEIKATFGDRVAFRQHEAALESDHCLVLKLSQSAPHLERVVYNGPIKPILDELAIRRLPSNGQRQITLAALARLGAAVSDNRRLARTDNGTNE